MQKTNDLDFFHGICVVVHEVANTLRHVMECFHELGAVTDPFRRADGPKVFRYLNRTKFEVVVVSGVDDSVETACFAWLYITLLFSPLEGPGVNFLTVLCQRQAQ